MRKFMLEQFASDQERLLWYMQTKVDWDYEGYHAWLKDENCFCVKFEDLYTECLGCEKGQWGATIRKIFNFLEVDLNQFDPKTFHSEVYGKSRTANNDVKDKIDQYKHIFRQEHYELLKTPHFVKAITGFGYSMND